MKSKISRLFKQKKNLAHEILIEKLKEVDPAANKETAIEKESFVANVFRKKLKKYPQTRIEN